MEYAQLNQLKKIGLKPYKNLQVFEDKQCSNIWCNISYNAAKSEIISS